VPSSQDVAAAPPPTAAGIDAFAFLAMIPSPVMPSSVQQTQGSGSAIHPSVTAMPVPPGPSAPSALPLLAQSAALPTSTAGGNTTFDFLTNVPSPVTALPLQPDQGADSVCIWSFVSNQMF
jgi:hypothetical protein